MIYDLKFLMFTILPKYHTIWNPNIESNIKIFVIEKISLVFDDFIISWEIRESGIFFFKLN